MAFPLPCTDQGNFARFTIQRPFTQYIATHETKPPASHQLKAGSRTLLTQFLWKHRKETLGPYDPLSDQDIREASLASDVLGETAIGAGVVDMVTDDTDSIASGVQSSKARAAKAEGQPVAMRQFKSQARMDEEDDEDDGDDDVVAGSVSRISGSRAPSTTTEPGQPLPKKPKSQNSSST
eukprot:m.89257 g.89257  ORF g.89257 m.89257 type:complete len:180 (-) comp12887_c0_seq1:272-811(-)